ncbi:tryptophan synthase subunit alpha [Dialister invisus]|uniref:tryptophan synthase subunit alpha n=1 Tax=Dialister invisus TaxID=218538 RepID=UPI00307B57D6
MSRIKEAFKDGKALIGFLTAGVPSAEDTLRYMEDLETAGADLIEIGVPFSDPVADGAVIMEADVQALKNKVHLPQVMEIVKAFRKQSETPLVFLSYYNPIFNYGVKNFFEEAKAIGLDGVAIPDLPYEEQMEIRPFADTYGIDIIQIIGPASEERICQNVKNATGFVYIVSSVESANRKTDMKRNLADIISVIRKTTDTPIVVGLDGHHPEELQKMKEMADGITTGSIVVDMINKNGKKAGKLVQEYMKKLKISIKD